MRRFKATTLFLVLILAVFLVGLQAGDRKEIRKTFDGVELIRFKTMTGNCIVKKAEGNEVTVHLEYEGDDGYFKPHIAKEGTTLVLRDKLGSGEDSLWTISVPAKTGVSGTAISGNFSIEGVTADINVKTISGNIDAVDCTGEIKLFTTSGELNVTNLAGEIGIYGMSSDLKIKKLVGELDIKTASGDIEAENLEGKISLKVASGDIEIENARGEFKIQAASGDIEAKGIAITAPSSLKVASGDVEIILAASPAQELKLAAASGNVVLDYNGNPVNGWFEFRSRVDSGRIICPFAFDKEEVEEKWGKKYNVKSFKKRSDTPKIYIHTSSGTAELKK